MKVRAKELIEVLWDDPWSPTETWIDTATIGIDPPKPHRSVGYVLRPDEHQMDSSWLVIAGTISGIEGQVSGVTCIPKRLIVHKVVLVPANT